MTPPGYKPGGVFFCARRSLAVPTESHFPIKKFCCRSTVSRSVTAPAALGAAWHASAAISSVSFWPKS